MTDPTDKFAGYHTGAVMYAVSAKIEAKRTTPPSPYTEDELMDDMMAAHKFGRNAQESEMLKRVQGIGTSRTRDKIISNHVERDMLRRIKKGKKYQLHITDFGSYLLSQLPESLKSVSMTALWELALADIAEGRANSELLKQKISEMVKRLLSEAFASRGVLPTNRTGK
jgi:DNA topoisomerase III